MAARNRPQPTHVVLPGTPGRRRQQALCGAFVDPRPVDQGGDCSREPTCPKCLIEWTRYNALHLYEDPS